MRKHEEIKCSRCGDVFECKAGDIANCQCSTVSISEEERAYISEHHHDCLCARCLREMKTEFAEKKINTEQR